MAVNIADYFNKASNGSGMPVATTLASQKASGAGSLAVAAATNWPTAACVNLLLYTLLADGKTVTPGSVTEWKGILSGTTVGTLTLKGGTDATYPSGSVVVLAPTNSLWDDLITGLLVQHKQDGTHTALTTDTLVASSTASISGLASLLGGLFLTGGMSGAWDGWVATSDAWTYASATTITVPTDATTRYSVGDKIKLTQSAAVKYFYVTAVAATVLTVSGGLDYAVANSAISAISYSKAASPLGFPQWFNYTPTVTLNGGGSNGNAVITGRFSMSGKTVRARNGYVVGNTTSFAGMTSLSFSTPVLIASSFTADATPIGTGRASDNVNSWLVTPVVASSSQVNPWCQITSTNYGEMASVSGAVPFGFLNTHFMHFIYEYEAA